MRSLRYGLASLAVGAGLAASAVAADAASVERVSLTAAGGEAGNASWSGSSSDDGRYTAFVSTADNLVEGDTNNRSDVFLRDRMAGTTRRLSVRPGGVQGNEDQDSVPFGAVDLGAIYAQTSISADGRYTAFTSYSTNLTTVGTTNVWSDVYVADRDTGELTRLSTTPGGNDGAGDSSDGRITPDGSHVVFTSTAADLAPQSAPRNVILANRATGELRQVCVTVTDSACPNGATTGDASNGGRWVAFASATPTIVAGDTNGLSDVFVRDMVSGDVERVSVASGGTQASGESRSPTISADGCRIAFASSATELVPGITTAAPRVYVRDRCTQTTMLASVADDGTVGTRAGYLAPEISADGCVVAFVSSDLSGHTPPVDGLVRRDLCAGHTERVDVAYTGGAARWATRWYSLAGGDGRFTVFDTNGNGVVPGDANGKSDVFLRDRDGAAPVEEPPVSPEPPAEPAPPPPPSPGKTTDPTTVTTLPQLSLTNVRLTPKRFQPVSLSGPRTPKMGATLSLRVSRRATVTMRYQRRTTGVRVARGTCAPRPRHRPVSGPTCTRMVELGRVRRTVAGGTAKISIRGRLGRKALTEGQYRMIVFADAPGMRRSKAFPIAFRIAAPG